MNYDAIFFDVGNTLFFYNCEFLSDFLKERFGVDVAVSELEKTHFLLRRDLLAGKFAHLEHDDLWRELYRRWMDIIDVDEEMIPTIIEAVKTHPFSHLFWSKTNEGTKEMLDWFRERGFKLGVISNAEGQIPRLIKHVGLDEHFEVIVDSGFLDFEKPDQRIFHHAATALKVEPARCIHVGDIYDVDVVGARTAGMTPILIDPEGRSDDKKLITVPRAIDLPSHPLFAGI